MRILFDFLHKQLRDCRYVKSLLRTLGIVDLLLPPYTKLIGWYGSRYGLLSHVAGQPVRLLPQFTVESDEDLFVRFMLDNIHKGDIVMDVGAFVGVITIVLAKAIGFEGRVIAFEPTPESRSVLHRHLSLNGVSDSVDVEPYALSDTIGDVSFFSLGVNTTNSLNTKATAVRLKHIPEGSVQRIKVSCTTLDHFVETRNIRPSLLKIDVEGAEYEVLRGGMDLLRNLKPLVACEIHPWQLSQMGHCESDVFELMAALGYSSKILAVDQHGIKHVAMIPHRG